MRLLSVAVCVIALLGFALDLAGLHGHASIGVAATERGLVGVVPPGSPAALAGLQPGDVIRSDKMSLGQRIAAAYPIPGEPVPLVIQRGSRLLTAAVVPVALPFWTPFNSVAWILTLLYAGMALLVAFRAPKGRLRSAIGITVSSLSLAWAAASIARAVPSVEMRFAWRLIDLICIAIFLTAAYFFVLWFPPRRTRATPWLWAAGLPVYVCSALLFVVNGVNSVLHVFPPADNVGNLFVFAASAAMIAAVVDAVLNAAPSLRKPAVIAGSSLVILSLVNAGETLSSMYGYSAAWQEYLGLLQWGSGFGMSYAVLRHRLVDLNLVISRAASFSVVSIALLGIFALLEWIFATLLEHTIGSAFGESGKTALAASMALLVGLSAGSIHRVVEHRLNRVFFARRYKALEDLHRFALETDATTDASALLDLTLATMRRNLDAQFVTLYTGTPETGYVAVGTTAADLPLRLDQNEEVVLRLRRWGEAFVVDNNESHPLSHAYVSPMMLRGMLYGFAICGPKIDRTAYLPDEKETVAALVHRVGIAYEWLMRTSYPAQGLAPDCSH